MRRLTLSAATALAALLVAGCASGRIKRENAAALIRADARVLEGCHDCLIEARDIYGRVAESKYVNRDSLLVRLFETHLLLALRAKELALDPSDHLARARATATRPPAAVEPDRLLAIVDAVLPDATGRPPDWLSPLRLQNAAFLSRVPGEVAWLESSPTPFRQHVRDYIALALDCSYGGHVRAPTTPPGAPHRRPILLPDASPLIMYRTATCLGTDEVMLAAVLAHVPAFHEAAYFAGARAALTAEEDGGTKAARLLGQAYDRFPLVTGLTYMSGWLAEHVGDCEGAVRRFDETLALDATHELALLEKTTCLSRLHRDTAAIESATQLLVLGRASVKLGYYWRAVSRFRLKDVELARQDIERAKVLSRDANILTLAGVIENEQNDLAIAEKDLREARGLVGGELNCTAIWTLGLVLRKSGRPAESGATFEDGMRCHEFRIAGLRVLIDRLRSRPNANPAFVARRVAAMETEITEHGERFHASAFNAAGSIANSGNFVRALELLAIASRDPKLAIPVAELHAAIMTAQKR